MTCSLLREYCCCCRCHFLQHSRFPLPLQRLTSPQLLLQLQAPPGVLACLARLASLLLEVAFVEHRACKQRGELVTYGAVLIDTVDGNKKSGEEVPRRILETWQRGRKEQVVGQAEILPVIVFPRLEWKRHLGRKGGS